MLPPGRRGWSWDATQLRRGSWPECRRQADLGPPRSRGPPRPPHPPPPATLALGDLAEGADLARRLQGWTTGDPLQALKWKELRRDPPPRQTCRVALSLVHKPENSQQSKIQEDNRPDPSPWCQPKDPSTPPTPSSLGRGTVWVTQGQLFIQGPSLSPTPSSIPALLVGENPNFTETPPRCSRRNRGGRRPEPPTSPGVRRTLARSQHPPLPRPSPGSSPLLVHPSAPSLPPAPGQAWPEAHQEGWQCSRGLLPRLGSPAPARTFPRTSRRENMQKEISSKETLAPLSYTQAKAKTPPGLGPMDARSE